MNFYLFSQSMNASHDHEAGTITKSRAKTQAPSGTWFPRAPSPFLNPQGGQGPPHTRRMSPTGLDSANARLPSHGPKCKKHGAGTTIHNVIKGSSRKGKEEAGASLSSRELVSEEALQEAPNHPVCVAQTSLHMAPVFLLLLSPCAPLSPIFVFYNARGTATTS